MKTLAYALVGCLAVLLAPSVMADCPVDCPGPVENIVYVVEHYPRCTWFSYTLDPPDYDLNPECLFPPN
ncbi:MAG: hypothetical protein ABR562_05980 [Thermoplasmatota archaeon]